MLYSLVLPKLANNLPHMPFLFVVHLYMWWVGLLILQTTIFQEKFVVFFLEYYYFFFVDYKFDRKGPYYCIVIIYQNKKKIPCL